MLRALLLGLVLPVLAVGAHADTLKLANGDVIHGEILSWATDHVVIEHPQLGVIRLSLEQLEIDTGTKPNPGLFGTTFLRGWKRNIGFGMNGELGTSDSVNLTASFDFDYADEFKRWSLDGRYLFNKDEDGDDGDNNARVDLRRDWLFPSSRWFVRNAYRYQFDQFEVWKHRVIAGVGPGYHVLQGEVHKLDVALLPTFTREFGDRNDNKAEMVAGFDYAWKPLDRFTFSISNQFFTELTPNSGEYRNFSVARWRLQVSEEPALDLSIRLENEYESDVDDGDDNNTLNYFLTMGIDF